MNAPGASAGREVSSLRLPVMTALALTPAGPMLPDAFADRPAMLLGTVRVSDAPALHQVLAEGGSGYHIFGKSAQKIVLLPRAFPSATRPDAA